MALKGLVNAVLGTLGYQVVRNDGETPTVPVDFGETDRSLYRAVKPYTLTSPERVYALIQATQYVIAADISGDIVECGVWKGGSMMAVARTLMQVGRQDKHLYLFDTFEGMPAPTPADVSHDGTAAAAEFAKTRITEDGSEWCKASLEAVRSAITSTGYDSNKIHLVKGKVEETLPARAPAAISLLRLDTDWYESTKHELEHLFPRLSAGGVIIIDDYGHWQGARRATDEFLAKHKIRLLLNRIDYTARIGVKA